MLFWILAAVMTVAVAIALLVPLTRRSKTGTDEQEFDIEVYRDQLREIDRDVDDSLISSEEAEFARAEVGRRLLKASKQGERKLTASGRAMWIGRVAIIVVLPCFAIVGYLTIGNPGLPAQPLAARQGTNEQPGDGQGLQAMIVEAENHLSRNPQDGRGWDVLAPIYLRLGRLPEAETAYRNSIRLLGSTAVRQAGLGQVLFARSGGIVTAEAQDAFQAVLALEPGNPFAAYFLALGLAQEGRTEDARRAFMQLAENAPPGAPWMPLVEQQLQRLSGPDSDDIAAAMAMAPEDRQQMIAGMVASLDARLQDNPDDIEGWMRLIRSYMVLGEVEEAGRALDQARDVFAEGSPQSQALAQLATRLGLDQAGSMQ